MGERGTWGDPPDWRIRRFRNSYGPSWVSPTGRGVWDTPSVWVEARGSWRRLNPPSVSVYSAQFRQRDMWGGSPRKPKATGRLYHPSPSVGFRGLWAPFPHVCAMVGGRMQKFLRKYLPNISVPSASYSNFGFRQLPPAFVGLSGIPWTDGNHLLIYCWGSDNIVCGRGGRKPNPLGRYLLKISASSDVYPICDLPQLPSAPASFREFPRSIANLLRIYLWDRTEKYLGRGRRSPKLRIRYLLKIRGYISDYPNFSYRQLLSDSVGFRGQ